MKYIRLLVIPAAILFYLLIKNQIPVVFSPDSSNPWVRILAVEVPFYCRIMLPSMCLAILLPFLTAGPKFIPRVRTNPPWESNDYAVLSWVIFPACLIIGGCISLFAWGHLTQKYPWMTHNQIYLYMAAYAGIYGVTFALALALMFRLMKPKIQINQ